MRRKRAPLVRAFAKFFDFIEFGRFDVLVSLFFGRGKNDVEQNISEFLFNFAFRESGNGVENIFVSFDVETFVRRLRVFNLNISRIELPVVKVLILRFDYARSVHFFDDAVVVAEYKRVQRHVEIPGNRNDFIKVGRRDPAFPFLNRLLRNARYFGKLRLSKFRFGSQLTNHVPYFHISPPIVLTVLYNINRKKPTVRVCIFNNLRLYRVFIVDSCAYLCLIIRKRQKKNREARAPTAVFASEFSACE